MQGKRETSVCSSLQVRGAGSLQTASLKGMMQVGLA